MRRALLALLFVLCAFPASAQQTRIFLTSGTTWTVPADWNSQGNTIEVIGHGGEGAIQCFGTVVTIGGGGGAYAELLNFSAVPGASVNIHFGGQSLGGVSDGVWLGSSATVFAESGWNGSGCGGITGPGAGGRASASVGSTKFSGGAGSTGPGGGLGVGAGGGAAGLNGVGFDASGATGGAGDNGHGGAGGVYPGGGTNGTEWDASHGSGGGGAGGTNGTQGGLYGAGGGYGFGGTGGLIVITYTPRNRVSSGVF